MDCSPISITSSDQHFSILAWYSYLLERLTSTARYTLTVLCLLLAGCGGGGGGGGGGEGGASVSPTPGAGALPVVEPPLFTAVGLELPAVVLPFTSELGVIATTPDGRKLYAADRLHNTVSVFDLSSNEVRAILDVGSKPNYIAISPDGDRAYVANGGDETTGGVGSSTVSVINVDTDQVIATLEVGDGPLGIAVTPDGSKAYVANHGTDTVDGTTVSVIDANTNVEVLRLSVGRRPSVIAITPDGSKAYVTNSSDGTVSVIDVENDVIIEKDLDVGLRPSGLAITPDGSKVYVTNQADDSVSVIDVENNVVKGADIPVGMGPGAIAISPDGSRAYVANLVNLTATNCGAPQGKTLSIIDVSTDKAIAEVPVGEAPLGIVITGNSTKAYAISGCENVVSVIDTALIPDDASNSVQEIIIASQGRSTGIAIAPNSSRVYVAHPNAISAIEVSSDTVVATIPGRGRGPTALAITPGGSRLYTANSGSDSVSVLNLVQNEHIDTLTVGSRPSHIAISPNDAPGGLKAYVANSGFSRRPDNTVSVIDIANGNAVSTLQLDDAGPIKIAITPDGSKVLVAHFGSFFTTDLGKTDQISVIDVTKNNMVTRVTTSRGPTDVKTDGALALVPNFFLFSSDSSVSIIDINDPNLSVNTILGEPQSSINQPVAISLTADDPLTPTPDDPFLAIVANYNGQFSTGTFPDVQHRVSIIDRPTGALSATVDIDGPNPSAVAITPDNSKAYVLNSGDRAFTCKTATGALTPCDIGNTVSVVDLSTVPPSLKTTVTVGKRPTGIVITGNKAYVTNFFDNTVSVIDTSNDPVTGDTVIATLSVGVAPIGVVVAPNGRVYVANSVSKTVSVIDMDAMGKDTVVETIPVNP